MFHQQRNREDRKTPVAGPHLVLCTLSEVAHKAFQEQQTVTTQQHVCLSLARNKNGRAKEANHNWPNFYLALIFQTKVCASEVDWITEVTSLLLENSVCQALVPLFTKFNLCLLIWNMKYPPLSLLAWAQPSRRQYRQTGVFHLNIGIRIYFQFHWLLLCYNEKVFDPGPVSYSSTSKLSDTFTQLGFLEREERNVVHRHINSS